MNPQKNAFTLVELIVVITILAILGTIAFISLQGYSKDARDSIRISDISSIKTSLELFHLNSGKYPLPDDKQIVDYGTETLWYQGNFGTTVISSLSRSMSEVPTDPLTDKKYVFSVANNKNEFEILSLLEGDGIALNPLIPLSGEIATAASLVVTPKIDGTYNRVFIKTASYIVPVPSIINTEVGNVTMTLDSSNISSQIINGGENIPEQGNVVSNTGALTGLVLSVYTGSIDINTSNEEKEIVIQKIKDAYTGSVLASSDIYEYILSKTTTEDLTNLLNSVVLNDDTAEYSATILTTKTVANCQTTVGEVLYGTDDGLANGTDPLTCLDDIIICDGNTGSGYTIAACNAGAIIVYDSQTFAGTTTTRNSTVNEWAGGLYQWGNNAEVSFTGTDTNQVTSTTNDSTFSNNTFIIGNEDWALSQNDNLWGDNLGLGTDNERVGPCDTGYHIPTETEWTGLHTVGGWGNNGVDSGDNMSNDLKLPMTGRRVWNTAGMSYQNNDGVYWYSTPSGIYGGGIGIGNTYIAGSVYRRAQAQSIRCFKN